MSFEVIPAIDIRGGRCVRLLQGDYDQETAYANDPAEVARDWEAQGAQRLHVVDLDGAREGRPMNTAEVAAICEAVAIPVEVSGGLR
ncbi:MAG: 1-(5-phosphoribosyl)-5-((5-phosphoribosylamino)methylideneamino)imidazole-4-carboxamide isomerase, partial [Dehalococcoidia bacterium]|nr:1-(5-phosphoribosyl)-5-((5-phosphoribosylamino)methylideneamino)imidazole-4-carboxamide isomerase [Dehalococcoidia bacterium]